MKRNGIETGAVVTPKRGGGYAFTRPNGRSTYTKDIPTQAQALDALKRYARGK